MGFFENQVRLDAGFESPALIGIALDQIVTHAVNHLEWNLCPGRIIQVNPGPSLIGYGKGWELGADFF